MGTAAFAATPHLAGPRGAVDFFLKIDGVDGESSDAKHKGEIDVLSWNLEATQAGTMGYGAGGGAGKVRMGDFHYQMNGSKATPKLFQACCSGEHFKKAVLICRKAGKQQQEFMKITMSDLLVSRYEFGGQHEEGAVLPIDRISLNFAKVQVEYKEQKADGTLGGAVTGGWNVQENKEV